jgi:vacuolar-type H+-ATPase subunit E/Vma4
MTSGLDAIRESIVREARDGAAALIKEANDERNRILAEARERAKVTGFQLLEEAKSEAQLRYKALRKLTVDTAELVEGDSFRVSANRKDLEILGESKAEIEGMLGSPGRRMIIGDALDCIGGVRVSDPDGKVVLDRTYESRMRRVKPELRSKIAQILTGGLG